MTPFNASRRLNALRYIMADEDKPMTDAPTTATAESSKDAPAADVPSTNETPAIEKPPATSEVVDSIEVEPGVKEEDTQADAQAESDAEGEEDEDDQPADSSSRPVSNELYKALKAITEALTDFKIKKGGE